MKLYEIDNSTTVKLENNLIVTVTKTPDKKYHLNVPYQYLGTYDTLDQINERLDELAKNS